MKTYLISCKGCEARLEGTRKHLNENNVEHEVFRGINGRIAGLRTIHPYDVDDPSGKHFNSAGRVALNLNHWFIWNEANRFHYPYIMVMEDDVRVVPGFKKYLSARIKDLNIIDPDWNFLYVGHLEGSSHKAHKGKCYKWVKGSIGKCKSDPYGTHCYIARPSAYPILLETQEKIFAGTDINLWILGIPHLRHYALVPPLAHQNHEGIYSTSTLTN